MLLGSALILLRHNDILNRPPLPLHPASFPSACKRTFYDQRLFAACRQVQDVAEQAFWDVLYDGLISTPQQWDRLVALIVDARNQLADIIPKRTPEGQGLLADMLDKLDEVCGFAFSALQHSSWHLFPCTTQNLQWACLIPPFKSSTAVCCILPGCDLFGGPEPFK